MSKLIRKTLWKVIPNTMYEVWRDAHTQGVNDGKSSVMAGIERNLAEHDLKDFDDPSLILGYTHAVKAMRGELTEVV